MGVEESDVDFTKKPNLIVDLTTGEVKHTDYQIPTNEMIAHVSHPYYLLENGKLLVKNSDKMKPVGLLMKVTSICQTKTQIVVVNEKGEVHH